MTVYSKKTKKGPRWYYQFIEAGEYHRDGGYPTRRDALQAEASERGLPYLLPKMAFGEVCDRYLTYIKDRNQSKLWVYEKELFIKEHLPDWYLIPVDEVTTQMAEALVIERGKTVSGYMGNKALKFLKAIFNYAVSQDWLEFNPCEGIQSLPAVVKARRVPTIQDFLKVCQAANPKERALLTLTFCTAGRIGEILGIKKSDILQGHIILRSRKHKDGSLVERKVPTGAVLRETVEWLVERSGSSEFLISNPREFGKRYLRRPKLMRSLCEKAGVSFFGFHSIRHLATSVLLQRGANLKTLQDLLGHANIQTTGIYIHSIGDSMQRAAETFDDVIQRFSTIPEKTTEKECKNRNIGGSGEKDESGSSANS